MVFLARSFIFSKWTKISSLEIIVFEVKNDGKKWSRIYLKFTEPLQR